jgi:hypothetical protein
MTPLLVYGAWPLLSRCEPYPPIEGRDLLNIHLSFLFFSFNTTQVSRLLVEMPMHIDTACYAAV